jgi:[NiFe] hydrogenase diaphorase moiety large subunit
LLGAAHPPQAGFDFDIRIHLGAGAYVCGEESALIESLEGKRGTPRIRPPFPVTCGYLGRPTVVNNVETLAKTCLIALQGGEAFAATGTAQSAGTKLLSISGDCAAPGIYEYPFGVSIARMLEDCGASDTQAVQVGGASGICLAGLRVPAPHRLRGCAHCRRLHDLRRHPRPLRGGTQLRPFLRP